MDAVELFGLAMSALIAISLTMKHIGRLRTINLIGALGFTVYGILILSWPVIFLNAFICVVNTWYLIQMRKPEEQFSLTEVNADTNNLVQVFISFYEEDIKKFLPQFDPIKLKGARTWMVLRNARPVSITAVLPAGSNTHRIVLDYAIPKYRDKKNGQYFFTSIKEILKSDKPQTLIADGGNSVHSSYLEEMGFKKSDGEGSEYSMTI